METPIDPLFIDRVYRREDSIWYVFNSAERELRRCRNEHRVAWIRAVAPAVLTRTQRTYVYGILGGKRPCEVAAAAGVRRWTVGGVLRNAEARLRNALHAQRALGLDTPQ